MPKIVILDMGHGGKDSGAYSGGLVEANLTGQLGPIVKQQLSKYDVDVQLAPRGTLMERAAFANQVRASLFVSLHINAGRGTGYETYIHTDATTETAAIAESIHSVMAAFYGQGGFPDRRLKRENFAVLRETKMPAVLMENLFIDNSEDAAFLRDNLDAIGNEIAWAIAQAMELEEKESLCPDLSAEVQKLKEILDQRDIELAATLDKYMKTDAELRSLRQVIKRAGGILAPYMI